MTDDDQASTRPPSAADEHLREVAERSIRSRYGRRALMPTWLVERDDDDGLTMLGRGLDDE